MKKLFSKPYLLKTLGVIFCLITVISLGIGLHFILTPKDEEKPYAFSGGSGSEGDPYIISSESDWNELAEAVAEGDYFSGEFFQQDGDLESAHLKQIGTQSYRINAPWEDEGCFMGNYDGAGFSIYVDELILSDDYYDSNPTIGLFAACFGTTIKNVNIVYLDTYLDNFLYNCENGYGNRCLSNSRDLAAYGGLVGYSYNSTIENCTVQYIGDNYFNGAITDKLLSIESAGNNTAFGGVVGYAQGSQVYNIASTGCCSIGFTSSGTVGGVIGWVYGSTLTYLTNELVLIVENAQYIGGNVGVAVGAVFSDCYNFGGILSETASVLGGVVGYFEGLSITKCSNVGKLGMRDEEQSENSTIGGIIGLINNGEFYSSDFTITDCFNAGELEGTAWIVGDLLGMLPSSHKEQAQTIFVRCYSLHRGYVECYVQEGVLAGLFSNFTEQYEVSFFDCLFMDEGEGFSVENPFCLYGYTDCCFDSCETDPGFYLNEINWCTDAWDFENTWGIAEDIDYPYPVLKDMYPDATWVSTVYKFTGSGTQASPYLISTLDDLQGLVDNIRYGVDTYSGKFFKQTTDFKVFSWAPIGESSTNYFAGTYDGDNHKIEGPYYSGSYSGIFGYCNGATIKNLGAVDVECYFSSYTGGIVGYGVSTKIINCYATGRLGAGDYVGGISGNLSGANSYIENCHSEVDIKVYNSSYKYTGGLVGTFSVVSSTTNYIKNSYNVGDIDTPSSYAGGLVGYTAGANYTLEISNSFNKGDVKTTGTTNSTGTSDYIGGLVGQANSKLKITSCYNTGSVTGRNYISGFVGNATAETTISASYHKGLIEGYNYMGGFVGKATSTFTASDCALYGRFDNYMSSYSAYFIGDSSGSTSTFTNCSFVGNGDCYRLNGSSSTTKPSYSGCYFADADDKEYTSGSFSGYTITTNLNDGYPMQNALYSVAIGGNTSDEVIANLQSKGFSSYTY